MAMINGVGYDFSNINVTMLGNSVVIGLKAISYKKKQEKRNVVGLGGMPQERLNGTTEFEGSITLTLKEVMKIRESVGGSLVDVSPFNIIVSYANGVDASRVDALEYVAFMEDGVDISQGADVEVVLPLVIGCIRFNQ